jgi:DNA-binding CsgD family transcriptional regulator
MRERRGRRLDLSGRPLMRSPGRPTAGRREHRQRFWEEIARGLSTEDAAVSCGVSPAVGARWFRHAGGMPPLSLARGSGRYLSFAEREEIAILTSQGAGVREIARMVCRSPSTISQLRRRLVTHRPACDRNRARRTA